MTNSNKPPLGVLVLYNESQKLIKGEAHDLIAENAVISCAKDIALALSKKYRVQKVPIRSDVELELKQFSPLEWVVFNLGEGVEGRLFECARIAWVLDAMGFRFTGASGDTLLRTTKKDITKKILLQNGIPTPQSFTVRDSSEAENIAEFPFIVKPIAEDGSLGIGSDSIVFNIDDLKQRVDYIREFYFQNALVEQFIIGRELNLSLWNNPPEVLPICEIDFSAYSNPYKKIVSYAAKWEQEAFDYIHTPVICPAKVDDLTSNMLMDIALRSWYALDCKDYARVDIRLDQNGNAYIVDVNCNPDLSRDAGFYRSALNAGYTYEDMVINILDFAIRESKK